MANVLVVDDDPGIRKALCHIVKMKEHTVFEAASGVKALEVLRSHPIDMAFVDIVMPEMSGVELMNLVREEHSHTKLVPMSSVDRLLVLSSELTGETTLTKPFEVDDVWAVLSDAFDLRPPMR